MRVCVYTSGGEKSPRPPGSDTSSTRVTSPSREGPLLYYYPRVPTGRVTWSAHAPIPSNFRRTRHPNSRIEILDRVPSPLRTYNSNFPIRTLLPFPFLSLDSFDSGQDPGQRSKKGKWSNFRVLGSLPLPWNNFFNRKKGKGGSLESVGISR